MSNAIETRAEGTDFRSRLEAKWGVFFGLIGWRWTYEPFDADYYIPDFLIHGEFPLIVEVKPYVSLNECDVELARITPKLRDVWGRDALVVGCDAILTDDDVIPTVGSLFAPTTRPPWCGDVNDLLTPTDQEEQGACLYQAVWAWCTKCDRHVLSNPHDRLRFKAYPCGNQADKPYELTHLHGCHYDDLVATWREAGNITKKMWPKNK